MRRLSGYRGNRDCSAVTVEPVSRDRTQVNSPQDVSSEVDHSVRSFFAKEEGLLRVEDNASSLVDPEVLLDKPAILLREQAIREADKAVLGRHGGCPRDGCRCKT